MTIFEIMKVATSEIARRPHFPISSEENCLIIINENLSRGFMKMGQDEILIIFTTI